jgi:hypothetical protein
VVCEDVGRTGSAKAMIPASYLIREIAIIWEALGDFVLLDGCCCLPKTAMCKTNPISSRSFLTLGRMELETHFRVIEFNRFGMFFGQLAWLWKWLMDEYANPSALAGMKC